jgi:hypothetical protein
MKSCPDALIVPIAELSMSRRTVARRLLFGLLVAAGCAFGTAPREARAFHGDHGFHHGASRPKLSGVALGDDREVGTGAPGTREAPHERRVAQPRGKLAARDARAADGHLRSADAPALRTRAERARGAQMRWRTGRRCAARRR